MRESVVIVGGGVAGLSAAHELVERGFDVHVYERRAYFGGKAASYRTRHKGADASRAAPPVNRSTGDVVAGATAGLPGEHGFRFFPGWYRHLTDTMSRIPFHRTGGGRVTVADNLVSVQSNLLAWFDRAPIALPLRLPRNVAEAAIASEFLSEFRRLGLTPGEVALFFKKLIELAVLPDDRRAEAFEGVSWWEYLECSQPGRSRAYQDLIRATTRTLVAAKAEEVSAFTIGRLAVRTFLDTLSAVDRVLNGPTAEVWLDPWVAYLKARGVTFHVDGELQAIHFDSTSRKVKSLVVEPVPLADARRLRRLIAREMRGKDVVSDEALKSAEELVHNLQDSAWLASRVRTAEGGYLVALHGALDAAGKELATARNAAPKAQGGKPSPTKLPECENLALVLVQLESDPAHLAEIQADYFVLALPLEQIAYYINRTAMLTFLAPELRDIVALSLHMDWMSGIQFYLQAPLDVAPGHLVGLDSTWGLTAIEQTQFWKDVPLPSNVKGILSVDISAWDKRGRKTRKEAFNCSDAEIADEVWSQLKEMLNKVDRLPVLRDDMLIGESLKKDVSYHLDDSVIDLRDRKKQADYERARGVKFNTRDLVAQGGADGNGMREEGYMWGPRRRFNAEPLLINRPGSRKLRPDACTSIPNLFLAGDYIKTETDLACMEGANEAARRAVNGILDATGSREPRCQIWPFSPSRRALELAGASGGTLRVVGGAAAAVSQLQDRVWKSLALGVMRIRGGSPPPTWTSRNTLPPRSGE